MGKKKDKKKAKAKDQKDQTIQAAVAKNQRPLDYTTTPVASGPTAVAASTDRELTKECIETALMALSLADTLQRGG